MARKDPPPAMPRPIMIGIAALLVSSMAIAVLGRMSREAASSAQPAMAADSRDLRFETGTDGRITVIDAIDDSVIAKLNKGEDGFVKVVLQSLHYERQRHDQDKNAAFRFSRLADGQLMLLDPTTGEDVNLDAFGDANRANFERLVAAGVLEK